MLTFTMSALLTESKAFSAMTLSMLSQTGTHTPTVLTLDITTCIKRVHYLTVFYFSVNTN